MISVAICGYLGKMGSVVVDAVGKQQDMKIACGIDTKKSLCNFPTYSSIDDAIKDTSFDVFVDFTNPSVVKSNLSKILPHGINCVVGTTGLSDDDLDELSKLIVGDACLFIAPNFTTGAVLMMEFSKIASKYFNDIEIIEMHHNSKIDAPSGTAIRTAQFISESRCKKGFTTLGSDSNNNMEKNLARGFYVDDIPIHSVRSDGFVASQEVIFGSIGQTLKITHDSWDRQSYVPGIMLGIRSALTHRGLICGLEAFM